jgi:hypothetical protein
VAGPGYDNRITRVAAKYRSSSTGSSTVACGLTIYCHEEWASDNSPTFVRRGGMRAKGSAPRLRSPANPGARFALPRPPVVIALRIWIWEVVSDLSLRIAQRTLCLGAALSFDYCKIKSYNSRRITSWTRMVFRESQIARDGAIRRTGLDRRRLACFGRPNMDTPRALDEDILYIRDEPARSRTVRRFLRAFCWISASGAIALVAWLTIAAISAGVHESRRSMCANQIRQLGLALNQYQEGHGQFPAPALVGRDGTKLLSWRVAILPELGYQALYERFHLDEPWDSPHNLSLLPEMPRAFACPGGPARRAGNTPYLVVVGPETDQYSVNTPFEPTRGADIRHITDGASGTILVLETDAPVTWTKPDDLRWTKGEPLPRVASSHVGGAHVALADGAARFIKVTIDPRTLEGLFTINGGEVLSAS